MSHFYIRKASFIYTFGKKVGAVEEKGRGGGRAIFPAAKKGGGK